MRRGCMTDRQPSLSRLRYFGLGHIRAPLSCLCTLAVMQWDLYRTSLQDLYFALAFSLCLAAVLYEVMRIRR